MQMIGPYGMFSRNVKSCPQQLRNDCWLQAAVHQQLMMRLLLSSLTAASRQSLHSLSAHLLPLSCGSSNNTLSWLP